MQMSKVLLRGIPPDICSQGHFLGYDPLQYVIIPQRLQDERPEVTRSSDIRMNVFHLDDDSLIFTTHENLPTLFVALKQQLFFENIQTNLVQSPLTKFTIQCLKNRYVMLQKQEYNSDNANDDNFFDKLRQNSHEVKKIVIIIFTIHMKLHP